MISEQIDLFGEPVAVPDGIDSLSTQSIATKIARGADLDECGACQCRDCIRDCHCHCDKAAVAGRCKPITRCGSRITL